MKRPTKQTELQAPRCDACRFHDGVFCRRAAPALNVEVARAARRVPDAAMWPAVDPADWCGEYQPRS